MKNIFKKFISILVVLSVFMVGCSSQNTNKNNMVQNEQSQDKKVIYTTFFPVTYLTKSIVGDKMDVRTIIKGNQEPHSFDLKANDMKEYLEADLIIYNGANMENFIPSLESAINDDNKFLNLSQGLTLLDNSNEIEENHEVVNPHTWLSVKNAIIQLDTIYRKISSIDPENEPFYKENLVKSQEEFEKLDKKFETELAKFSDDEKYFVVSHAAFNYLANDYGLKQVAVTGISPEDEPSAKQLKKIAEFVKKHNISTIFFEGKATPKVAQTLASTTNTKISTLYTMESLTEEEIQMGYLKLMEFNLNSLVESFNK